MESVALVGGGIVFSLAFYGYLLGFRVKERLGNSGMLIYLQLGLLIFTPSLVGTLSGITSEINSFSRPLSIVGLVLGLIGIFLNRSQWPEMLRFPVFWGITALVGSSLIATNFSTEPVFVLFPAYIWVTVVSLCMCLNGHKDVAWLVRSIKTWLFLIALYSLGLAIIYPWALQATSGAVFSFRLHGASQANHIAPMALTYLILTAYRPARWRAEWLWAIPSIAVLILAQSKTTWAVALIIAVFYFARQYWPRHPGAKIAAVMLVVGVLAYGVSLVVQGAGEIIGDSQYGDLATLTGRTQIWEISLNQWRQNPWWGYGPMLWSTEFRLDFAPEITWSAPSAHNQYIQQLGAHGLFGLIGLVICLLSLVYSSAKSLNYNQGIAISLVIMMLIRSISEAPLWITSYNDELLSLALIAMFSYVERKRYNEKKI
ncbi:O-antigen ligase family protein [Deinococcus aquaticus]|uniref:O-antigen ligase family protein n=1 Tax=Deinococcus aquaticus TaxID=328692 RepID=UPI003F45B4C4